MSRLRTSKSEKDESKTPMDYVHFRGWGSTSICGINGVHTTRVKKQVSCWKCQKLLEKMK